MSKQDILLNKNKIGRPKLSNSERKKQITGVRLRTEERVLVEKAAANQNKNLSDWIRETLVSAAGKQMRFII